MAFVDTILPYLGEEQKGEPLFFMYQTEPVIKHAHTHTHTRGREGWATIYDITVKIWETGSGFHGVLKISTCRELGSPLFSSCCNSPCNVLKTSCLPTLGSFSLIDEDPDIELFIFYIKLSHLVHHFPMVPCFQQNNHLGFANYSIWNSWRYGLWQIYLCNTTAIY